MFECKYKLELSDCLKCSKYVYRSQKRKQDKVIAILLPVLLVMSIGMLIYDVVTKRSLVWDIVVLVALVLLQIMYLLIPLMLIKSQKKSYEKQGLAEMDYIRIKIDEKSCVEEIVKNEEIVAKNSHNLKLLTSYVEDETIITLIFSNVEFVCIKKEFLVGDLNKLKNTLQKAMRK